MDVGVDGSVRGFLYDGSSDSFTYGSIVSDKFVNADTPSIRGTEVSGFTPLPGINVNIDLRRITWNQATGNLDFWLGSHEDAEALHEHWLVAGKAVMHLTPEPSGSDVFYRAAVPNPDWSNGQRVTVQLWDENPDPDA